MGLEIVKGDFKVSRVFGAQRANVAFNQETITASKTLAKECEYYQSLSASEAQDVILPDATTLPLGWGVCVIANGTGTLSVKASGGTLIHTVATGSVYEFVVRTNGDAAGVWFSDMKNPLDSITFSKYVKTFNATTDWGTASGGQYTMAIAESVHNMGATPFYQLEELSGSDYIKVIGEEEKVASATGDITIRVSDNPDGRFAGRCVVL